jgi:hypothetical protein
VAKKARVTLEIGPKGKKVVAVAPDWPGLERGAKTREDAIERLRSYLSRYSAVVKLAGLDVEFDAIKNLRVVEEYPGTGSTDFWGISFAFSSIDKQEMSSNELERELTLMQACWVFFDGVRKRVSAEMQKGPIGVLTPEDALLTVKGLKMHRESYCQAIREYHSQGKLAGKMAKWPLKFLIRHTAFHTMDHAWEMEDKDLTAIKE